MADHPDASAAELARLCFVTRQSLGDVLTVLRTAGLVETADVPPLDATMTEGLSRADRRQLTAMLTRCAENLESS